MVKFYIQQENFFYLVVMVNDLWEKTKEHAPADIAHISCLCAPKLTHGEE